MQIIKHPGFADEKIMQKSLELLLNDRHNEFEQLADTIGIPKTTSRWECIILSSALTFEIALWHGLKKTQTWITIQFTNQ